MKPEELTEMMEEEFEDEELDMSERAIDYRCALTDMGQAFNIILRLFEFDKNSKVDVMRETIANAIHSVWDNCPEDDETLAISLTNAGDFTTLNKFLRENDLPCIHD